MDLVKKLNKLQADVEAYEKKVTRAEGQLEQIMVRLKETHGVDTVEEAQALLEETEKKRDSLKKILEKEVSELAEMMEEEE